MLENTRAVFERVAAAGEPLTTREVTDHLDCTRRTAYNRLQRLADRGSLETKKVGARGRIWWRPPADTVDPSAETTADVTGSDTDRPSLLSADSTAATVSARQTDTRAHTVRIRQQEVVAAFGQLALESHDVDQLLARGAELVSETLDTDYAKVLDLDADDECLLLRQGVGWNEGLVGETTVSAVDDDSQAAHTLRTESPIIVENLTCETRFSGPPLLTDHDVTSGISTIIGTVDEPWGILGAHDTDPQPFTKHDVNFVQSIAHILSTAINRHEYERELERQRAQLDALNDLSAVIRDITDAVVAQSTRDEIERLVCDRLADTEAYQSAWIGELDRSLDAVEITATAGRGTAEHERLSLDEGPAGGLVAMVDEAVQTQTVQVRRTVALDSGGSTGGRSTHDEVTPAQFWRSVGDVDLRSFVVIPIVHEGLVFGVVTVATDRADAFECDERAIIDHLGEIVGHAVVSIERKRALMSDEVIELRFRTEDLSTAFGTAAPIEGSISIHSTVEIEEGRHVAYGTVTDDAVGALRAIADAEPHWTELTLRRREQSKHAFEVGLSEPPVTSTVAAQGGDVIETRIVDGSIHLSVHLPPGADVRAITDVVEETYPGIELTRREQLSRRETRLDTVLETELTDRQRTALEASYRAGFFEWPRPSSGKDVAETLDISPSTYHQHLRTAERKLFDRLFD